MDILRYMFQLNLVIWKQRKYWSNEVVLSTTLMKMVALHSFRLQKCTKETFRYFTQIDADINIRNVCSNTALHNAAYSGSVKITNSVYLSNADDLNHYMFQLHAAFGSKYSFFRECCTFK